MTSPFSCSAASSGLPRLFQTKLKVGAFVAWTRIALCFEEKVCKPRSPPHPPFWKVFRSDTHGTGLILNAHITRSGWWNWLDCTQCMSSPSRGPLSGRVPHGVVVGDTLPLPLPFSLLPSPPAPSHSLIPSSLGILHRGSSSLSVSPSVPSPSPSLSLVPPSLGTSTPSISPSVPTYPPPPPLSHPSLPRSLGILPRPSSSPSVRPNAPLPSLSFIPSSPVRLRVHLFIRPPFSPSRPPKFLVS